jgi:hypothetical protein
MKTVATERFTAPHVDIAAGFTSSVEASYAHLPSDDDVDMSEFTPDTKVFWDHEHHMDNRVDRAMQAEHRERVEERRRAEDRDVQIALHNNTAQNQEAQATNRQNHELLRDQNKRRFDEDMQIRRGTYGAQGKVVSFAGDSHIPAGKVLELTIHNPDNPTQVTVVNVLVQLRPLIADQSICKELIVRENVPTLAQRWMQYRAGEISFWHDFILNRHQWRERDKAIRKDTTGIIGSLQTKINQKRIRNGSSIIMNAVDDTNVRSRNVANAVLIFNEETVLRAKAETGQDFFNKEFRDSFFDNILALSVVTVDPMWGKVRIWYNGFDEPSEFTFDQMKPAAKGGGNMDLISIMNAINQGRSPKF